MAYVDLHTTGLICKVHSHPTFGTSADKNISNGEQIRNREENSIYKQALQAIPESQRCLFETFSFLTPSFPAPCYIRPQKAVRPAHTKATA